MKVKFLKKFLPLLCAASISVSMSAPVFSIKTTSHDEKLKSAVSECNRQMNVIKPQIDIYLERLTDQIKRLTEQKNCDHFEEKTRQISQVSISLSKIQQLFQQLDNFQLNNLTEFNILDFNQYLLDLETYMTRFANHKNINLDEISEIIQKFNINYWNECINGYLNEDEIFDEFDKNDSLSEENDVNNTLKNKVKICLNNLEKNPSAIKYNEQFIAPLVEYAKKYVSEYEGKNLKFIQTTFKNPDKWCFAFDKYVGSDKFVKQVTQLFNKAVLKNGIDNIVYNNVKEPKISTISDLDCLLKRIIVTEFKKCTNEANQYYCNEFELTKYLSYILELNSTLSYIKDKTVMSNKYNEFNLNFSALKLRDLEQIFEKLFENLTGKNWICTLSMSDDEIDEAKKNKNLTINDNNKTVSNKDIDIIDLVRYTCSPINKIMTLTVSNKLSLTKLDFSPKAKMKIQNLFNILDNNINQLCSNLKIVEDDSGRAEIIYNYGTHIFKNNSLPKPVIKNALQPPKITVILNSLNNNAHNMIPIHFMMPYDMFQPNPLPFAHSAMPVMSVHSESDIPMQINIPMQFSATNIPSDDNFDFNDIFPPIPLPFAHNAMPMMSVHSESDIPMQINIPIQFTTMTIPLDDNFNNININNINHSNNDNNL